VVELSYCIVYVNYLLIAEEFLRVSGLRNVIGQVTTRFAIFGCLQVLYWQALTQVWSP